MEAITNAEPAIPLLLLGLKDSDSHLRQAIVWTLASIHKRPDLVVPALVETLADTNRSQRASVLNSLRQFDPIAQQAAPAVEEQLSDTNSAVRAFAMAALRAIDTNAAARAGCSLPDVLRMLQAPAVNTRKTAAYSLFISRDAASSVVPALIPALADNDHSVRNLVVSALRQYEHEAQPALPALTRCLEDPDKHFRTRATNAIIRIAPGYFVMTDL